MTDTYQAKDTGVTMRYSKALLTVLALATIAFAGSQACRSPQAEQSSKGSAAPAYTPPPQGTASLVESVHARRTANRDVIVAGKLLLPVATRVWVELYPAGSAADADPVARAELYLAPGGAFETEALKAPDGPDIRVVITSHFTRSWQAQEVLTAVGAGGMKLPKSALKPDNPANPQSAGHLEYTGVVKVTES
jgi:hypothetical protein